jgi:diguanylate cyclase (GGDEF)-like protein/PAS domain S-box-containing protein
MSGSGSKAINQSAGSRRLAVISSLFAIAFIIALTLSLRDKGSAERSREAQIALSRLEVRVQEVHSLEWLAIAAREITPEVEARLRASKRELLTTTSGLRLQTQEALVDQFGPAASNFIQATDRQLQLIQNGKFEEARRLDFEEVSQQFDVLQHQLHQASDAQARVAEAAATKSRIELVIAFVLVAASIALLFLRFQRQEQLMFARQAVLQQSEERFRALTEKSADIVFITDSAGVVNYVSPSIEMVLAFSGEVFNGRNLGDFVQPEDISRFRSAVKVVAGESETVELRFQHSDGRWLYFECVVRNLLKLENINGLVFNAREITDRKKAEEQLLFNASHDVLTSLPNRIFFLNRLQTVVDRIQRHREQMAAAVLFVDVDDFKVVNDCLGHAAGDELIVEVGNRLKTCMRSDGSVARIGGDEFTVMLEDITDPSDAIRVAQRIHSVAVKPFLLLGQEVCKGVSIGIALVSQDSSAENVVQNADIAMHRAKSKGKGRTELFDVAMHEHVMGQLQLEARLRRAVQNSELELYYQPIVALRTGLIEGFEALLRWNPLDSDSVPPGVFIPVAERSGLIVPISSWVLTTGCLEAVSWHRQSPGERPLYISINISARHFSHSAFIGHIREALEKSGIPPECVKIELTESVAMNDAPSTEQTMSQLRVLGVGLSIDDFGTGYSSLSYLRRFPVDTLKIDQSFVSAMQRERENWAIVSTVVVLGRNLRLQVVAEGVETLSQLEKLRSIGCDAAQGYFFSKPVPSDAVKTIVDLNKRQAKHAGALEVQQDLSV